MMSELDSVYTDYLESGLDRTAALRLAHLLRAYDLLDEGNLLLAYLEHGPDAIYTLKNRTWQGRDVYAGQLPPTRARAGDLWFDVVELTLMTLVPAGGDEASDMLFWVATHPVSVWQFRAFLNLVRWSLNPRYHIRTNMLLNPVRFELMDSLDPITAIYHEEACAYALWFSKSITSQFNLESAGSYLSPEQFKRVLPPRLRLWHKGFSGYNYLRIAIGADTLDENPWEDIGRLEALMEYDKRATLSSLPGRLMFGEWERHEHIGFATKATHGSGLIPVQLPGVAHDFIILNNLAPRPALYPPPDWRSLLDDLLRGLGLR